MDGASDLREKAALYRRFLMQIDDADTTKALSEACEKLEADAARIDAQQGAAKRGEGREIYTSENGDRWSLILSSSGSPRILHQANAPAGAHRTEYEIDTFLTTSGRHTPQHQALLRLFTQLLT